MGLLDWLKGKKASPSADPSPGPTDVDWIGLENHLADALTDEVRRFATRHDHETFYGIALDCNAYYANVLLCANTPTALDEAAARYANGRPIDDDAERESLRWGLGDWKYQGFNLDSDAWRERMAPRLDEFAELPSPEDTERFLVACCRVLLRLEGSGLFRDLQTTPDFRVACIDHDEDLTQGDARLDRIRSQLRADAGAQ
jgi:hypothetical protein